MTGIDEIDDAHIGLGGVLTVQAACVLLQQYESRNAQGFVTRSRWHTQIWPTPRVARGKARNDKAVMVV